MFRTMSRAEKFIQDYTRNCSNSIQCYDGDCNPQVIYKPWLTPDDARKAVEIAREEMIERACDAYCKVCDTKECEGTGECLWVNRFRKAMKL